MPFGIINAIKCRGTCAGKIKAYCPQPFKICLERAFAKYNTDITAAREALPKRKRKEECDDLSAKLKSIADKNPSLVTDEVVAAAAGLLIHASGVKLTDKATDSARKLLDELGIKIVSAPQSQQSHTLGRLGTPSKKINIKKNAQYAN